MRCQAEIKCSLPRACPPESYPFHIWSGAANVVGPKICFNGKIIMSHVLNNIGPGINLVEINEKSGAVERCDFLNMENGDKDQIFEYLKKIKPGSIVLAASYIDITPKMTDEMRQIFEEIGSTKIRSVNKRDMWVFAGKMGTKEKSLFERVIVNDPKTNLYGGWPSVAEVGGCILKTQINEDAQMAPEAQGKL
ncbi:protein FAM3C [Cheilinus undulatus]|uniref:protein FAM3C n=1 Tax=Cheilinus undulatus TaxID=241271 RepID=UPI001BD62E94|nr:protein FAM3C [Cheilinus undulatus]